MVERLSRDELLALGMHRMAELSPAFGVSAIVVDLAGGGIDDGIEEAARLPCVVIGIGSPAPWVDVAVTDAATAEAVAAAADRTPFASVALTLLSRGGETRTTFNGLVAESATYSLLQAGPEYVDWRRSAASAPVTAPDPVPPLRLERSGERLEIVLTRPHVHNAYDVTLRDALFEALGLVASDLTIERVVLRGEGPSFCSGGDLREFGTTLDPATAHTVRLTRSVPLMLASVADRVEVELHGACIGAGIELAAYARRVIAHPSAAIALPEIGFGLVPGAGGTVSIPRRIGRSRFLELALTGRTIDAATAIAWGLADA